MLPPIGMLIAGIASLPGVERRSESHEEPPPPSSAASLSWLIVRWLPNFGGPLPGVSIAGLKLRPAPIALTLPREPGVGIGFRSFGSSASAAFFSNIAAAAQLPRETGVRAAGVAGLSSEGFDACDSNIAAIAHVPRRGRLGVSSDIWPCGLWLVV